MPGRGFVYLVGAGPGDPRLLTLRAWELLRSAEVVAHDELVAREILALAPPGAELLPVGRRRGHGTVTYRLHPDVLERARAGRTVVRLKCGDPFVFGRGGEEAEELALAGIPFEVVPGVSAALGAAAYAGIPLTHREHASSVTFETGHRADETRGRAGETRGRPGETVVIYMAARRLAEHLARLAARGVAPSTPAAYIAWATTPRQEVVVGTLADLPARVAGVDARAPALVIVGDVVSLRRRVRWFEERAAHAAVYARVEPRRKGLLLVYTGHGKGKTTAALGLIFRALGRRLRPAVVQFLKGRWKTGERAFAEDLPGLTFLVMGEGFTWESDDLERDRRAAARAWATAKGLLGGDHDVVVLDELTYALSYGFVAVDEVIDALRARPPHVHVVVTGRNAPQALCELADLVTEMRSIKHPFERGLKAQPGIDY